MSLYEILGLTKHCTKEDIKNAYKKLALKFHPDKNIDKEYSKKEFIKISQAYEILYNDETRNKYDNDINFNYDYENIQYNTLFKTIFKDFDPTLREFMLNTFKNIDKEEFIKDGIEILSNYIFTQKSDTFYSILDIQLSDLNKKNNIIISLDYQYLNQFYEMNIYDTKLKYTFKLNTKFNKQTIEINKKTYYFTIIDDHPTYKRVNIYDLYIKIDIGIDDYFEGFVLNIPHFKENITKSIQLNNSTILKLKKYGLPLWNKNEYGDLYIYFNLINKNRLHPIITKSYYSKTDKIDKILSDLNLYN